MDRVIPVQMYDMSFQCCAKMFLEILKGLLSCFVGTRSILGHRNCRAAAELGTSFHFHYITFV